MPKLKTKKTLAKRIKISGKGKARVGAVRNGHLKRKFDTNRRHAKKGLRVFKSKTFKQKFKKMLGKKGRRL